MMHWRRVWKAPRIVPQEARSEQEGERGVTDSFWRKESTAQREGETAFPEAKQTAPGAAKERKSILSSDSWSQGSEWVQRQDNRQQAATCRRASKCTRATCIPLTGLSWFRRQLVLGEMFPEEQSGGHSGERPPSKIRRKVWEQESHGSLHSLLRNTHQARKGSVSVILALGPSKQENLEF